MSSLRGRKAAEAIPSSKAEEGVLQRRMCSARQFEIASLRSQWPSLVSECGCV